MVNGKRWREKTEYRHTTLSIYILGYYLTYSFIGVSLEIYLNKMFLF